MLVRLLALIFTFNTLFFSTAFATGMAGDCKMMSKTEQQTASTLLSESSSHCNTQDMQKDCDPAHCITTCIISSIPLITDTQILFLPDVAGKPPGKMAYFYQITLPVKTPPPLV